MFQMIAQHLPGNTGQRLLNGSNLNKNIRAVAIPLHHIMQAANLSLNSFQAMQITDFLIWINRQSFPPGTNTVHSLPLRSRKAAANRFPLSPVRCG